MQEYTLIILKLYRQSNLGFLQQATILHSVSCICIFKGEEFEFTSFQVYEKKVLCK